MTRKHEIKVGTRATFRPENPDGTPDFEGYGTVTVEDIMVFPDYRSYRVRYDDTGQIAEAFEDELTP